MVCVTSPAQAQLYATSQSATIPESEISTITIDGKDTTVLRRSWSGKNQFGLMVIVPGSEDHKQNAGLIGYLRHQLNPKGWATLKLMPPAGLYRPNFATPSEEIAKEGQSQITLPAHQAVPKFNSEQLLEIRNFQQSTLTETLSQLADIGKPYPGARVLIAMDDSAAMVTHLLYEQKIPMPDLLVLINPYREHEHLVDKANQRKSVSEELVMMSVPTLDIYSADAHPLAIKTAQMRKQYNQIKPNKYYRQYFVHLSLSNEGGWEEVLDRIEGFARVVIGR
nr:DUF3530 family protein [Shewanella gaetbuli]